MPELAFRDGIMDRIRLREPRFDERAYLFVLGALEFCQQRLPERRHITGRELALSVRRQLYRLSLADSSQPFGSVSPPARAAFPMSSADARRSLPASRWGRKIPKFAKQRAETRLNQDCMSLMHSGSEPVLVRRNNERV